MSDGWSTIPKGVMNGILDIDNGETASFEDLLEMLEEDDE